VSYVAAYAVVTGFGQKSQQPDSLDPFPSGRSSQFTAASMFFQTLNSTAKRRLQ
jgi:hypothetical protein